MPRRTHVSNAKHLVSTLLTVVTISKRDDFTRHVKSAASISDGTPMAWIDWDTVVTDLDTGLLPASGGRNADLDLPPIRLRDLRRGAATLALASHTDLKVIQQMLGHSSIVTTADTYTSVLPETAHRAAHETGELAERVRLPLPVPGQPVPQRRGDRALQLRGAVAVNELVNSRRRGPQQLAGRVPGALDGSTEQAGSRQEHAAPVGLDRVTEAALGARVKPETSDVRDEDVGFHPPTGPAGAGGAAAGLRPTALPAGTPAGVARRQTRAGCSRASFRRLLAMAAIPRG